MMGSWYCFGIILAMTVVQAETNFSFLSFPTAERFLVLNDTEHSPRNASFLLNLNAATMEPSCGRLLYNQTIRMKNATSTGALASFHTAFTFRISGSNRKIVAAPVFYHGDGLAFTFARRPVLVEPVDSGSALCLVTGVDPFFAVEFDTYKTAAFDDSSDSHVGVNLDSMISTWSYSLCESGEEYCSYLCNGGYFTAWIDYYSRSHILQVFLARGSLQERVSKPGYPLIDAEVSAQMANLVDEFMYVGFSSSTGLHREVNEIKSWTFTSSMTELATAPPSSPRPAVSSPGSRRKQFIVIAGIAAGVLTLIGFFFWKLSPGLKPLRIFISHTGGPTGSEKNFAVRLYDELKASAKRSDLKYEVFIDLELPKGMPFPSTLFAQMEKTNVALVVVSEEFFKRKWPMIELTKFVEMHRNPSGLVHRVLPLFYKLTVAGVRSRLEAGYWERDWTEMSSDAHPIHLEKCYEAVETLCVQNGVEYRFRNEAHEADYIKDILQEVKKICKQWTDQQSKLRMH